MGGQACVFYGAAQVSRDVAQISNLLYRRLPAGNRPNIPAWPDSPTSADWKSAIQQTGSLRYVSFFL